MGTWDSDDAEPPQAQFASYASEHLHGWLRFATSLTRDRAAAEDLVQDVLIKLDRDWDRISAMDRPDAYVQRMLVNQHLMWRRKWARLIPSGFVRPSDLAGPDPTAAHADREALSRELAKLAPRQRTVLVLRYFNGLADADIAEMLGCSETSVRGYASRALARLRVEPAASLIRAEGI